MPNSSPFPDSPEAITPEWLTGVLAGSLPGTQVARVEVLDQHSGTTGRMRIGLEYAAGAAGPKSVFVKLPPFDDSQRQLVAVTDMGRREARFYEGPASETPMLIPHCYYAAHGEEPTQYVMVLEDLQARGCSFTNRLEPHAEENAQQVIESLARLHAHFWNDQRFDNDFAWLQPAMRSPFGAQLIDSARDQFADKFPPVFAELAGLFIDNWERITEIWDEGERTLIHGDTHAGNHFVDGHTVGLYDWAVISCSPGIRDIAIYFGNSCPTELRRRDQDGWLRAYHQVLLESGIQEPPSLDELLKRLRLSVLYAWISSATTAAMGSKWQPIEVGMLGMTRATEACADLETVEAFRELL